jgi:hypothetical protein
MARRASELMAALDRSPEDQYYRGEFWEIVIEIYQADWPIVKSPTNRIYSEALVRADRFARAGDGSFLEAVMMASLGPYGESAEGSEGFRHILWVNLEINPTLTPAVLYEIGSGNRARLMQRWYDYAPHDYDFAKIAQELGTAEWPEEIEADVGRLVEVAEEYLPEQ